MLASDSVKNQNNHKKSALTYAFEAVPMYRRTVSLPDTIQKGDAATALGMAAIAAMNLPEDLRDLKGAKDQVISVFTGKPHEGSYKYKDYQHNFSFFRGTAIDKWVHKNADEGKSWAKWLIEHDKTLAETNVGKKLIEAAGGKEAEKVPTGITNLKQETVSAAKYEGSTLGKWTGRAMRRVTKVGVLSMGLLEVPRVLKAFEKGDDVDTAKQIGKSAINVAGITAGVAYCGAIGSKYGKGLGSLVGMGAGAILGGVVSNKAQSIFS